MWAATSLFRPDTPAPTRNGRSRRSSPCMKTLRVFPHKTNATPDDADARIGHPGMFDEADKIHVSVTFRWDILVAEKLAKAWEIIAPVEMGGVALGDRGGNFVPGLYLKQGYVITSRGCPNHCWFCDAWKREGDIRELPITDGYNVLDNNLLACSDSHVQAVFDMLKKQRGVQFTGGLESARLKDWHVAELVKIKPKQIFFAYDTPNDLEPLRVAGKKLLGAGFTRASHVLRCFVLIGAHGDTPSKAAIRMRETMDAGFMPMAMFYRPDTFTPIPKVWHDFQWFYSRPAAMRKEYINL
jgi:hypothetical protein